MNTYRLGVTTGKGRRQVFLLEREKLRSQGSEGPHSLMSYHYS